MSSTTADLLLLPSPKHLSWIHAVDNRTTLRRALQDDTITAIETDLVMGTCTFSQQPNKDDDDDSPQAAAAGSVPIMAHPPSTTSDLSMVDFLQILILELEKHATPFHKVIKLDFKDYATVEPTMKAIVEQHRFNDDDNDDNDEDEHRLSQRRTHSQFSEIFYFLNADILPGPGRREKDCVSIPPDFFLETCLQHIQQKQKLEASTSSSPLAANVRFGFSLGFKTDFKDAAGYTHEDVRSMADLLRHYERQLQDQHVGVVLALNARLLQRSLSTFHDILTSFPSTQILAWTGKGEPSIPQALVNDIRDYYSNKGWSHRIGFDCQVQPNSSTPATRKRPRKDATATQRNDYDDPERKRLETALQDAVMLCHCLKKESIPNPSFFLPHPKSIGVGKFSLEDKHVKALGQLSRLIVDAVRGHGVTWGDLDDDHDEDPRRRMYGFLHRETLLDSGVKVQGFGRRHDEHHKEHKRTLRDASVDLVLTKNGIDSCKTKSSVNVMHDDSNDDVVVLNVSDEALIYDTLCSVTEMVHSLVPTCYKQFVTMDQLVAVQPNLHNGASYLPAHLDFPRLDGFGVVIVTIGIRGLGKIVLIDDGDEEDVSPASYAFDLGEGETYILCGDARNKCAHGVLCEKGMGQECTRETLNLRYGLHTQEFAHSEIDQHWG